jgi:DNA segregation ATPase FtsK/SpoIIIE, S-DNA-T family
MSRIDFHRPARIVYPQLPTDPVILSAPPQPAGGDGGMSGLYMLMPLMSTLSVAGYMFVEGKKTLIFLGIGFVVFSVGITIAVRMSMQNKRRKVKVRGRDLYLEHLADVRTIARQVAGDQRLIAACTYPSPYRLWAIATERRRVWERRRADKDFLKVCVGVGQAPLSTPIRLAARNDPTIEYDKRAKVAADQLIETMSTVGSQPAVVDLAAAGVVSVLGAAEVARGIVGAMLCQIGVLHAPDDVGVLIATGGEDWEWAKWLPHTHHYGGELAAGVMPFVSEEFEGIADRVLEALEAAQRQADGRGLLFGRGEPDKRRRLVVVLDRYDPRAAWARSPLAAELLNAAGPGSAITVICIAEREEDQPTRADVRVRAGAGGTVTIGGPLADRDSVVSDIVADWPEPRLCEAIARELAPLRLSPESEEILAQVMSLPSMLGIRDLDTLEPKDLWVEADDEAVLQLPLGFDSSGRPLVLDLKEAAQGGMGPHGLIVGATGSGKSELLRTLVTGLSVRHSPDLLSFVLVDFKGGATFAGVTELPHVAGMITNLVDDLALVDRVKDALVGEQQRRQRILRDAGNIDTVREYQLRRAAGLTAPDGSALPPLPYLLIIVDEFGELLSGRPDFVDLFVQIGRVGRSLGMHLLLATQRLEEGKLRGLDSNLSYRICLRTFSAAESRTVIGSPDAYRLPPIPGSAYLKVADSEPERFRVALVSGPHLSAAQRSAQALPPPMDIAPFRLRVPEDVAASAEAVPEERPKPLVTGPSEMSVMVDRVCSYGQAAHQVWLPPLPDAVPLDALIGPVEVKPGRGLTALWWPQQGTLSFPLGVLDLPIGQMQYPLLHDFAHEDGHLVLVGSPQSGKSTFLRTLMLSAMLTHTPDEVQFFCLDYGGGALAPFGHAPHVSGVAGRHEQQRARRVLAELQQLIGEREALFRALGLDSADAFRRRRRDGQLPGIRAADVFLLVDNWGAARGELEGAEAVLLDIANRGLGVAVHLVLTTNRWADLRMALRDSISGRLELRHADPGDSEINRRAARQFNFVAAGRGMVPPGLQVQMALPRLDGADTAEQLADAQEDAIGKVAAAWTGAQAPPVRMLPERVTVTQLGLPPEDPVPGVPIGMSESDLAPVHLDLTRENPHFLVFGDSGSGKSAFLRTWITGLVERNTAWEVRIIVIDYRKSLLGLVPGGHLGAYAGDPVTARDICGQLAARLAERLAPPDVTPQQLRDRSWWSGPDFYVVVDDYDMVGGRQSPLAPLADFVPQAREIGLHIVLARRVAGYSRSLISEPLFTQVKDIGADGLILSGDPREGVILGDWRAAQRPPGRGILVRRKHPGAVVQIAVTEPIDTGPYPRHASMR